MNVTAHPIPSGPPQKLHMAANRDFRSSCLNGANADTIAHFLF